MLKRENLRPFLKPPTGIGRGRGGRKSGGLVKMSPVASEDKRYVIHSEWSAKQRKSGHFGLHIKAQSEGFKAIFDSPEGTRFTASYLFGGDGLYEVRMRGSNTKVVQRINEDGRAIMRYRTIRSAADVKKLFNDALAITILGGTK